MLPEAILKIILGASFLVLALGLVLNLIGWSRGRPSKVKRTPSLSGKIVAVLKALLLDLVFQRPIFKRSFVRWVMHILLSLSMIGLTLVSFVLMFHPTGFILTLIEFLGDLFGGTLLFGTAIAIGRRIFLKNVRDATTLYDVIPLALLLIITVTGFGEEHFRLAVQPIYQKQMHTAHVISIAVFFAYLPFSKFFHFIATPIVTALHTLEEESMRSRGGSL